LLIAWKGRRDAAEEKAGAGAAERLGLVAHPIATPAPFPGATARHLYAYEKIAPTPPEYPRRPGVARKRPLGG
jgi:16S rRNA (guanine527-N7)-methyltransferase